MNDKLNLSFIEKGFELGNLSLDEKPPKCMGYIAMHVNPEKTVEDTALQFLVMQWEVIT